MSRGQRPRGRGFTLVELLVVLGVVSVLLAVAAVAGSNLRSTSRRAACLASMRSVGVFVLATCTDDAGRFPRSQHSAVANGEAPWMLRLYQAIHAQPAPASSDPRWTSFVDAHLRCPFDGRDADPTHARFSSYGLNVYFELAAAETGGPTFRTLGRIPRPVRTVLLGELDEGSLADHLMAHFWSQYGTPPEAAPDRHGGSQGTLFVDGHVEDIPFAQTYQPSAEIDLWNPAKAR